MIHIASHFVVPALIVGLFFRKTWRVSYLLMMATMLVDVDHVFATPIYDAGRCSIGFHPLHKIGFIVGYAILCFVPKTRIVGIGLVSHMALDSLDCQVTNGIWTS
jgi:hypothetical protein